MQHQVVTFVLAGGRGNRLFPLTEERAKPAVPFVSGAAKNITIIGGFGRYR